MLNYAHKIAAGIFVLWGLAHVAGGSLMLQAALQDAESFLNMLTGAVPADASSPGLSASTGENGRGPASAMVFAFHSFNLIWLGALSIGIAVTLNWRNRPAGAWINLAIVGLADAGLLIFMVGPGVMGIADAWIGPLLFVLAALFLWLAANHRKHRDAQQSPSPA